MATSIRIRILNRDFSLVVERRDEERTRELAAYVDSKIRDFRRAHPEQPEVTAAIIAAMAIAEELFTERDQRAELESDLGSELGEMAKTLGEALAINGKGK